MLPFDLSDLLSEKFARERRPPDGKLHPSGDLIGSLRHSQLRAAGAPTVETDIVSDTRLMTGTLWHTWFEGIFDRLPVMTEVKLDRWLPRGWSGTADWLIWSDKYRAFILGDLKTTKGEALPFIERDGIKQEHLWQLSSYWYAARAMGIPLVDAFCVFYLPMNATGTAAPLLLEAAPLDEALVLGTMESRWHATETYLGALPPDLLSTAGLPNAEKFINEYLAPVQERVQVLRYNKPQGVYDVKLAPHWSAQFCPYPSELCNCNEGGTEKIGHYAAVEVDDVMTVQYVPRNGYAEFIPTVTLGNTERKKLLGT